MTSYDARTQYERHALERDQLDAAPLPVAASPIGTSGFSVAHVPLPKTAASAHTLIADRPIGAQVVGYGLFTSYQVPGGLNLKRLP